jgi:hypothetical protein
MPGSWSTSVALADSSHLLPVEWIHSIVVDGEHGHVFVSGIYGAIR